MKCSRFAPISSALCLVSAFALLINCAGELEDDSVFDTAEINRTLRDPAVTRPTPDGTSAPAPSSAASSTAGAPSAATSSTAGAPSTRPSATAGAPSASATSSMAAGSSTAPMLPPNCNALQIMTAKCAGCHPGIAQSGWAPKDGISAMLDKVITTDQGCTGKKVIDTANPEDSLLSTKMLADPPCGNNGSMALLGSLNATESECISDWAIAVAQGAR